AQRSESNSTRSLAIFIHLRFHCSAHSLGKRMKSSARNRGLRVTSGIPTIRQISAMRIGTIIGIISLTPHVAESRIGIGGISMTAGAKSGLRIMVPLGTRNNMSQQYIAVRIGLNRDEVIIEADDDGLEMIAATLLRLRGRSGPSA